MAKSVYIGSNDKAQKIKSIYIGIDGVARKIKKAYIGDENGKARLCFTTGTPIGEITVGSVVKVNENGSPVDFYIATHDYESGLNGSGKTLLVRKDSYPDSKVWHSSSKNAYATSDIDAWLNGEYKSLLDADIQNMIGTTQFYYTPGNYTTIVGTLSRSVFLLSVTELGRSNSNANVEGSKLPIAETLRVAYQNGSEYPQWTRTPHNESSVKVFDLNAYGTLANNDCTVVYGARPCFTLPSDLLVDDNFNVIV